MIVSNECACGRTHYDAGSLTDLIEPFKSPRDAKKSHFSANPCVVLGRNVRPIFSSANPIKPSLCFQSDQTSSYHQCWKTTSISLADFQVCCSAEGLHTSPLPGVTNLQQSISDVSHILFLPKPFRTHP